MVSSGPLENSFSAPPVARLAGLDIARFLAFVGMVLVNFKVATNASVDAATPSWLASMHPLLEGRAAALFVLLAGLGIGLGVQKALIKGLSEADIRKKQAKRGLILFAFGLLNLVIFDADILHFYGIYFLFACIVLAGSRKMLLALAFAIIVFSPALHFILDYETGWDWQTLQYHGLWSFDGFIRNTFYNGFHPVFPWISFLLFGMALAQLNLASATVRLRIAGAGLALMLAGALFAQMGRDIIALPEVARDRELIELIEALMSSAPLPPSPIYMISASGIALVALVLCLWLGDWFGKQAWMKPILTTGQQALTLYIAHIIIGMGIMEAMGWIAIAGSEIDPPTLDQVSLYSAIFLIGCMVYAVIWRHYLGAGPLERLLRKLSV
jgi:uncharacterized membrane protein YeiB